MLVLLTGNLFAQSGNSIIDSLSHVIATSLEDTTELAARCALYNQLHRDDPVAARAILDTLIEKATAINHDFYKGEGYLRLAIELIEKGSYDTSLIVIHQAQASYKASDDSRAPEKYAGSLINEGVIHQSYGNYEDALAIYEQVRELKEIQIPTESESKLLNNMGAIFRSLNRIESAIRAYNSAIELKEEMRDTLGLANSLYNLGVAKMRLGETADALAIFERSKNLYTAIGETSKAGTVNIGIGGAYYSNENFDVARTYWEEAINTPGIRPSLRDAIAMYIGLGDLYIKDGSYTEGLELLSSAEELAERGADVWVKKDIIGGIARANYELGNYELAARRYRAYQVGVDTLFDAKKLEAAQEMSEKYEAELREAEIDRQKLVIESQNNRAFLLALGVLALAGLALGIFLIFRYRLRYQRSEAESRMLKKEQQLQAVKQQAELNGLRKMIEGQEAERHRVAKDLHDGLGGMLSSIKTRIALGDAPKEEADKLLDVACQEVRRIAHNMVPQSLALSGLVGSLEDIRTQLQLEGLDCELEIIGQPELRLNEQKQSMLLRIVQELTHNIVRHAEADRVFIQLLDQPNQLLLTIEDDGKGFDTSANQESSGLGLSSIDSRVNYLKGEILYDSQIGRGTTVSLNIPL